MCDSCEESDDYAEGYSACEEVEGRVGRDGMKSGPCYGVQEKCLESVSGKARCMLAQRGGF